MAQQCLFERLIITVFLKQISIAENFILAAKVIKKVSDIQNYLFIVIPTYK